MVQRDKPPICRLCGYRFLLNKDGDIIWSEARRHFHWNHRNTIERAMTIRQSALDAWMIKRAKVDARTNPDESLPRG